MNTKQKVGNMAAIVLSGIVSVGAANEANAQYPAPNAPYLQYPVPVGAPNPGNIMQPAFNCPPRQVTIMQETSVVVPVTTWQQQKTMVPQTQWVQQTTMVEQTQWVAQTQYTEQKFKTPVTYQMVDQCMPRCDIRVDKCMPNYSIRIDSCRPRHERCDISRRFEQFFQGQLSSILNPCARPAQHHDRCSQMYISMPNQYCAPRAVMQRAPAVPYCLPRAVPNCSCR